MVERPITTAWQPASGTPAFERSRMTPAGVHGTSFGVPASSAPRMRAAMGPRSLPFEPGVLSCRGPRAHEACLSPQSHKPRSNPMSAVPQSPAANDPDSQETQEWLDALEAVLEREGPERAHFLRERLIDKARRSGAYIPFSPNTAYVNTIAPHMEEHSPGHIALEERIRS